MPWHINKQYFFATVESYSKRESKVTQFNTEMINSENSPLQEYFSAASDLRDHNAFLQGKKCKKYNGIPANVLS